MHFVKYPFQVSLGDSAKLMKKMLYMYFWSSEKKPDHCHIKGNELNFYDNVTHVIVYHPYLYQHVYNSIYVYGLNILYKHQL